MIPCLRCGPDTDPCSAIDRKCVAANQVVKASELEGGDFFRKLTGTEIYLVISRCAVNFYDMDYGFMFGVSRCGNMCHVAFEKDVVIVDGSGFK